MAQKINVLGIDIAKLVFHIVGMDDMGPAVHCYTLSPCYRQHSLAWKRVGVPTICSSLIISGRRLDYITIPSLHSARIAGPSG
jgi:hypothetical protein